MILNRGQWWLLLSLTCVSVILLGCGQKDRTAVSPTGAKAEIQRILFKQTGQKQFEPGMDLKLPMKVAKLRSQTRVFEQQVESFRSLLGASQSDPTSAGKLNREALATQLLQVERAWEAARMEVLRKENELAQQENTYIRSVREQIKGVRNYEAMYRIIGQQLATADGLLADPDPSRRRMGLKMAREACGHANSGGMDVGLAARICEAYFWPNLHLADAQPGSREHTLDLLETARRVFFETDETNNVLKNYSLLLSNAPNAKAADIYRVQVADWLEEKGSLKHANEILGEIRDAEVLASAQERITRVRERVAGIQ
jgi:hypothetical protein